MDELMRKMRIVSSAGLMENQLMNNENMRQAIGTTELMVPKLIFGTSALGNLYRELDLSSKLKIVESWFREMDPPVCIDSAGKYGAGLALEEIGNALRFLDVPQERVIISNKLGWKRVPLEADEPTFEPGVWKNLSCDAVQSISYEGILECWEQGNRLLGSTCRAQMLSVHDPDEYIAAAGSESARKKRFARILDAYRALDDLKKDGEASAIGVGSKDWRVIRDLVEKTDLDWVMLAGSLTVYTHPRELLQFIAELDRNGVFVINSALFNSGFLVGGTFFDYKPVNPGEDPELFHWRSGFNRACRDFGVSSADACVEFGLAPRAVKSVAMNTTRPERVGENVASVEKQAPREFWERLLAEGLISVTPEQLK
ncbi:aldo/keto reductase [Marispirochaeta sp.]|uniref:aldo/keto reductase n=1 Tax=Marispirochaeta sp. TaxID=2038653 RepID=UPI0029C74BAF|nr:aldo/keto reductase [Marispirochaeta sp.]